MYQKFILKLLREIFPKYLWTILTEDSLQTPQIFFQKYTFTNLSEISARHSSSSSSSKIYSLPICHPGISGSWQELFRNFCRKLFRLSFRELFRELLHKIPWKFCWNILPEFLLKVLPNFFFKLSPEFSSKVDAGIFPVHPSRIFRKVSRAVLSEISLIILEKSPMEIL